MSKRVLRRQAATEAAQTRAAYAAGFVDARNLIAEIARTTTPASIDPKTAGLIPNHAETIRRMVSMDLRQAMTTGTWSVVRRAQVFVTDQRLILRPQGGGLDTIAWPALVGFEANISTGHVSFDFGEGAITLLSGAGAAVIAVAGIWILYGGEGLRDHPALQPLRDSSYLPTA